MIDALPRDRDRLPAGSRYEVLVKIASGGMGTVYVGRLRAAVGFRRLVAIKRAHAHLLESPGIAAMLGAEARLTAAIHHANVVAVHDVEEIDGELLLVMDYVEGASLAELLNRLHARASALPAAVAARIALDVCAGLAAAHDLRDDDGRHLGLVHRDLSPQNILVGVDGVARLSDFGVAKCLQDPKSTAAGGLKGKVSYMAPEYIERKSQLDQRSDVFGLGVVIWEALTGQRLFGAEAEIDAMRFVLSKPIPAPSALRPGLGPAFDGPVLAALRRDPMERTATARELASAIEAAARREDILAEQSVVGEFVRELVGAAIQNRRAAIRAIDAASGGTSPPGPSPEPARPKRWLLVGGAGALLVLVGFAATRGLAAGQPRSDRVAPVDQAISAPTAVASSTGTTGTNDPSATSIVAAVVSASTASATALDAGAAKQRPWRRSVSAPDPKPKAPANPYR